MQETPNPIKELLFDYISRSEKKNHELISQSRFKEIIDDVLENCYDQVTSLEEKEEGLGVLATGLLHYLLTNALIPSQRKVTVQGTEVDIVIPDLKTLGNDPKKTLLICIPKTLNEEVIEEKLRDLRKIQPQKENIWLVLTQKLNLQNRVYVIEKKNPTFSNIIYDIGQFVNLQGQSKFKILRI